LGLPAASLPARNTRSEMSPPIGFGGMGVGDLVALTDAAHIGAPGLAVGSAIRFLSAQDARVRENSIDDVPMEPTMYRRVATAMTTAVSHRPCAPDTDGDDNEPMWSLELASAWTRLDAACDAHALSESGPLVITAALAMLHSKRSTVARAGCVAEVRSNNEHTTRSLDGLPSPVPLFGFATDIFESCKPSASTCFASPTSPPRFLTPLGRSLDVLHFVPATENLRYLHRTRPQRVA
jgi:hypothetical protein